MTARSADLLGAESKATARFPLRLGVVSHVPHCPRPDGGPVAFEPYVREMNLWARLFSRVDICAPMAERAPYGNEAPYTTGNVHWIPTRYSLIPGVAARSRRMIQVPSLAPTFARLIKSSDLVLLRSPSSYTMCARVVAQALGARTITKWAGPFHNFQGEPVLARIERAQVRRGPGAALVYGPSERPHLISFIPFVMSEAELLRARSLATGRRWSPPWKILSVGRLGPEKGFDLVLRGLMELRRLTDIDWRFTLVGDGFEASALRKLAGTLGISDCLQFTGAVSVAKTQEFYAESHCVITPGLCEGWPKTIAEAWAHGAFPVVAAAGIQPWLIRNSGVGVIFEPTPRGLADTLATVLSQPAMMREASLRGPEQCADLTHERFAARLEQVLVDHFGLA